MYWTVTIQGGLCEILKTFQLFRHLPCLTAYTCDVQIARWRCLFSRHMARFLTLIAIDSILKSLAQPDPPQIVHQYKDRMFNWLLKRSKKMSRTDRWQQTFNKPLVQQPAIRCSERRQVLYSWLKLPWQECRSDYLLQILEQNGIIYEYHCCHRQSEVVECLQRKGHFNQNRDRQTHMAERRHDIRSLHWTWNLWWHTY